MYVLYIQTLSLVKEQLELLQTTYIDLYMLHSPIGNRALQVGMYGYMYVCMYVHIHTT